MLLILRALFKVVTNFLNSCDKGNTKVFMAAEQALVQMKKIA